MNYKHKITNVIVSSMANYNYYYSIEFGTIHKNIVENSSDWEEISPKKLFTTHDGIDIYEGDYHCYIGRFGKDDWSITEVKNTEIGRGSARLHGGLDFSTLEKAQEYVDNMKPILSHQDIKNTLEYQEDRGYYYNYYELTKVIKEKLEKLK